MNKDLGSGAVVHHVYVARNGKLTLTNDDDDFYKQQFDSAAEYFALINYLVEQGNKHFGASYKIGVNNGFMNVDYVDGVHVSDFAGSANNG